MSRVNLGLHQSDVSVAWDLGPHDFSILRYWLDETPSHVSAMSRSCVFPSIPDVAFINLEFGRGAIAHVELSWLAPSKLRRTTVVGSRKMVVYDDVEQRAGADLRLGRDARRSAVVRGVPALVPDGRHRLPCNARPRAAAARDGGLLQRDPDRRRRRCRRRKVGVEVVRMIEAVDASLVVIGQPRRRRATSARS